MLIITGYFESVRSLITLMFKPNEVDIYHPTFDDVVSVLNGRVLTYIIDRKSSKKGDSLPLYWLQSFGIAYQVYFFIFSCTTMLNSYDTQNIYL